MLIVEDLDLRSAPPRREAAPPAIGDADAAYAFDIVEAICTNVGPGVPGSRQERERAAVLRRELESHLGTRNVTVEAFTFADGFLRALPIGAGLLAFAALLGVADDVAARAASLVLSVAALALVFLEFMLDLELIDRLLPKKTSLNVIGALRRPATTRVDRVLVVSGHHDSAPESTWMGLLGYGGLVYSVVFVLGLVAMVGWSALRLAGVRTGAVGWLVLVSLVVPSIVYGLFFNRRSKGGGTVPGAADNLAASALTIAICRYFVRNPSLVPADTELRFISFGAEEAGLRGSRRYVARHLEELRRADVRVLNFETVAHPRIGILTSDVGGSVKHSPEMVRSVVAAAQRARVPYEVKAATFGVGTDAAPFSRAGVRATALLPFDMPRQLVAFYHQPKDRPEVLSREALRNVLSLAVEWIRARGA